MMDQEIRKAIGAHGLWKGRLKAAIETGKSEFTVADVSVDSKCEFGKWLHSLRPNSPQSREHYENVKRLHFAFHQEVAKVLSHALTGKRKEALKALDFGSAYSSCSSDLTREMLDWSKMSA